MMYVSTVCPRKRECKRHCLPAKNQFAKPTWGIEFDLLVYTTSRRGRASC